MDNAFDLIFAFDEIVALGYRENVNLAQIRTFTEMDSHEEKVYEAMRKVGRETGEGEREGGEVLKRGRASVQWEEEKRSYVLYICYTRCASFI